METMPKGWFGPKVVGWGASPRSWEGWLATIVFVAALIATRIFIAPWLAAFFEVPRAVVIVVAFVIELAAFLLVVRATYDPGAT